MNRFNYIFFWNLDQYKKKFLIMIMNWLCSYKVPCNIFDINLNLKPVKKLELIFKARWCVGGDIKIQAQNGKLEFLIDAVSSLDAVKHFLNRFKNYKLTFSMF